MLVAFDSLKVSCVQVLLIVVESYLASGGSEVDNVKLVVLQVGHFGVVAENEGNSVASRRIPGLARCEIHGELITDGSVCATTELLPAGDSSGLDTFAVVIHKFRALHDRLGVLHAKRGCDGRDDSLNAVSCEITAVGWPGALGREVDRSAGWVLPVKTFEKLAGRGTVLIGKCTLWRILEGLNLSIVSICGGLVPTVGALWSEGNTCSWSQPASLLIEVGEALGLGCPVVSGGKGGNESGNEEFH